MAELRYPILMVHGMGFRDHKYLNYWGRIPAKLEESGCRIFYGNQDSNAAIETNAKVLADRIKDILEETGAPKLNVIAHSKGGLDIRCAISKYGLGDKIASVTTMSTPHHGSVTVDKLLKLPDFLVRFAGKCTDIVFKILGDKNPDSYSVFKSFSTKEAEKFNEKYPDSKETYYRSYAFAMKSPFADMFLWFTSLVVWLVEGENDGLLAPRAVKWGDFKGVVYSNTGRGISHCDEVDMRRCRLSRKQGDGVSDIPEFYKKVVLELADSGF
ncbi:lipase family alpha/beta hydrolase [Butyrivibrio sp. M55]|uniref:lipase family alpha/beta hydrolase n=1 Tax=Butyrivibrio sp. M55 TaxID=1855323 RepID=UPI0008E0314A|nr:alpha/beta fold hydrolase [Butyrivibrio sp. M55]SFU44570.1 triacylglycerol lipase [Butyrivibrio sp. M55]